MLLLALLACPSGPEDTSAEDTCTPSLHIGGSETNEEGIPHFTEMPENSEQVMIHGPQGGWHILASADVEGLDEIVTLTYTIAWPARDEAELSYGAYRVLLVPDEADGCGGSYPGMFGVLSVAAHAEGELDTPPELLHGETLRIHMRATDESDRLVEADRYIVAVSEESVASARKR